MSPTVHFLCTIQGKAGANGEKSDRRQSRSFPIQATTCQPVLKSWPRIDLIRNHQVGGSSPPAGSNEIKGLRDWVLARTPFSVHFLYTSHRQNRRASLAGLTDGDLTILPPRSLPKSRRRSPRLSVTWLAGRDKKAAPILHGHPHRESKRRGWGDCHDLRCRLRRFPSCSRSTAARNY